eukprot:1034831-Alexandrium_andersonii.AAC.1
MSASLVGSEMCIRDRRRRSGRARGSSSSASLRPSTSSGHPPTWKGSGKVVLDGGASDVSTPTSATPTTTSPTAGPKFQSLHDILMFVDDAPDTSSSRPAATLRKLVLPAEAFHI